MAWANAKDTFVVYDCRNPGNVTEILKKEGVNVLPFIGVMGQLVGYCSKNGISVFSMKKGHKLEFSKECNVTSLETGISLDSKAIAFQTDRNTIN